MGTENMLLHIDQITVDGKPLPFEDGSGIASGFASFTNTVVPSASGDDFEKRARAPRIFKAKIQFGSNQQPGDYNKLRGIQITARDSQTGRRCLMTKCSFGEMGDLGGGSVDITFNVLSEPQWL
ncbi:hypothetical protein [Polaromonas sp. UC242_47]|uniref:hypothetical protein n=1 Tax=Polaromonas sp. UC242_47 TaxID=3374626 RepID=UPI003798973B